MSEIKVLLKQLLEGMVPVQTLVCTVKSVDKNKHTCTVQPEGPGEPELHNVRLNAAAEISDIPTVFPKENSLVLVSLIGNDENAAYVSLCTEVEEISGSIEGFKWHLNSSGLQYNDGKNGGLIVIGDLVSKINGIEKAINSLVQTFNLHTHVCAAPGSPSAPALPVSTVVLASTLRIELENTKIKH